MCDTDYPLIPLTLNTIQKFNDACHGRTKVKDDICCLNCVCWPITFVLDIIFCPCCYAYYKYKKPHQPDGETKNIEKEPKIQKQQPI
jgi:hypothetical protein